MACPTPPSYAAYFGFTQLEIYYHVYKFLYKSSSTTKITKWDEAISL